MHKSIKQYDFKKGKEKRKKEKQKDCGPSLSYNIQQTERPDPYACTYTGTHTAFVCLRGLLTVRMSVEDKDLIETFDESILHDTKMELGVADLLIIITWPLL